MQIEVRITHKTCRQITEWRRIHQQIGVYPQFEAEALTPGSEHVERMDFATNHKMICEQCNDVIYVGAQTSQS